ncbi:MAG: PhoPQ-activated pathogenicity-related family protein [Acidobacteria bacterium]|nr:PhoPQ-activated pathogenicity-related family protein [Acidobacteriota bacterium]
MPVLLLLLIALRVLAPGADFTALDRYIAAPDASYQYALARTVALPGVTAYQLNMVSQTWLTTAEVDRPEWRHWVTIIRPANLRSETALLFINGGSNSNTPPTPDALLATMAVQAGVIVVNLGQVPNHPLRFAGESQTRTEDGIIAYTWDRFLRTGDERWPARLPMTKAAVRAMDASTEFLAKLSEPVTVRNFIVAGGSKRGWTTWTVAAVDPRVVAIAPIVIDTLNMQPSFVHHWRAYGFWAPAVQDYVDAGVMNWFQTPQIDALAEVEDPYQYRDRLTLPKYIVCSTGDQFFLPDSSQFYFGDLPGEKYLRYVPNTDHGMSSPEAALNIVSWLRAITRNFPRPRFSFRADRTAGTISVRVVDKPGEVLLWQATNPDTRDFRLEKIGPAWKSTPLRGENGIYTAAVDAPAQGWTAFFVELRFPGPDEFPLVFTTEVVVTPDVYPFDPPPGAQ